MSPFQGNMKHFFAESKRKTQNIPSKLYSVDIFWE